MGISNRILSKDAGITLIELIFVMIIIGILVMTVSVQFVGISDSAKTASCLANQASLRTAVTVYWTQNLEYPSQLEDLVPQMQDGELPVCPGGGSYLLVDISDVTCSLAEHQ